MQYQQDRHQTTGILSDDSTQRYTFDLHVQTIDQCQRCQNVDDVLHDTDHHRNTGVLHADAPA